MYDVNMIVQIYRYSFMISTEDVGGGQPLPFATLVDLMCVNPYRRAGIVVTLIIVEKNGV